jgi:hypothetical protein
MTCAGPGRADWNARAAARVPRAMTDNTKTTKLDDRHRGYTMTCETLELAKLVTAGLFQASAPGSQHEKNATALAKALEQAEGIPAADIRALADYAIVDGLKGTEIPAIGKRVAECLAMDTLPAESVLVWGDQEPRPAEPDDAGRLAQALSRIDAVSRGKPDPLLSAPSEPWDWDEAAITKLVKRVAGTQAELAALSDGLAAKREPSRAELLHERMLAAAQERFLERLVDRLAELDPEFLERITAEGE